MPLPIISKMSQLFKLIFQRVIIGVLLLQKRNDLTVKADQAQKHIYNTANHRTAFANCLLRRPSTMHEREVDDFNYNETKSCDGPDDDLVAIEEDEALEIAKNDTIAVVILIVTTLVVLVCSALGVALATYFYISKSEQSNFESQFHDDTQKIFESIESTIDKTLGLFDGLAVTMVSYARASGEEWPFVTLPDFGVRLAKILPLSKAIAIYLIPVITSAKRSKWEAYTTSKDDWVNDTLEVQYTWDGYYGPTIDHWEPQGEIHGDFGAIPRNET
jgi:hypothetical protein